MIFVTVGTHEQQFNRLVAKMDELKHNGTICEEVIIQTGFSTYEPKYCRWEKLFPYSEMLENVRNARIIITHGGPSSFMMSLQEGKVPIVVPRQKKYDEHVNNHQVVFCRTVFERYHNIIVVEDIDYLAKRISEYDVITQKLKTGKLKEHNTNFTSKFESIIDELFC